MGFEELTEPDVRTSLERNVPSPLFCAHEDCDAEIRAALIADMTQACTNFQKRIIINSLTSLAQYLWPSPGLLFQAYEDYKSLSRMKAQGIANPKLSHGFCEDGVLCPEHAD